MKTSPVLTYITITLVIIVLPVCAFAQMTDDLVLYGEAHPALSGLGDTSPRAIVIMDADADKYQYLIPRLEPIIQKEITIATDASLGVPAELPALAVKVIILEPNNSSQCILRVQTCLRRTVCLPDNPSVSFAADVWQTPAAVQLVDCNSLPAALEKIVAVQAKSFAHSCIMSNPRKLPPAEKPAPERAAQTVSHPAVEQTSPTEAAFVASKNSDVFHRADCSSAKRIKPENLIGYNSPDEAIQAGKKPCKRCKP